jgi:hypothetical protein
MKAAAINTPQRCYVANQVVNNDQAIEKIITRSTVISLTK